VAVELPPPWNSPPPRSLAEFPLKVSPFRVNEPLPLRIPPPS
jgi:hypothetical protein